MLENNLERFYRTLPFRDVGPVYRDLSLERLSRWRVGGYAECVVCPRSLNQLGELMKIVHDEAIPYIVVGSSSNMLFSDEGLKVLVVHIGKQLSSFNVTENRVVAQSGVWAPVLARNVAKCGLSGFEHIVGIPGTLGGLICMNGGSKRKGIGDFLVKVTSVAPDGELRVFKKNECQFSYRRSIFQSNEHIVAEAEFELVERDKREMLKEMLEILKERRAKFPRRLPNCGSVFVSNPSMYAEFGPPGKVIEQCGFKGMQENGAQVSPVHANFIVNNGGAKAADILHLIYEIRSSVFSQTGYALLSEVKYVSPLGEIVSAHEEAEKLYG